eukprot:6719860-Alexandrium_andersonii.AAC.1
MLFGPRLELLQCPPHVRPRHRLRGPRLGQGQVPLRLLGHHHRLRGLTMVRSGLSRARRWWQRRRPLHAAARPGSTPCGTGPDGLSASAFPQPVAALLL